VSWDPKQYALFGGERLRPARELIAAIAVEAPSKIIDLGCGDGRATRLLAARWPGAGIIGVDNSPEMLDAAAKLGLNAEWRCRDLGAWQADGPVDLVFSNAALHWLPDHDVLVPQWMRSVSAGGVLAIQVPDNFAAPSHRLLFDLAEAPLWRGRLSHLVRRAPVARPSQYFEWLRPLSERVDIWDTEYLQILTGEDPVLQWIKGTWLRPFLAALDAAGAAEFEREYGGLLRAAYPRSAAGETLFPFKRLFIVARRAS
jgi:trans-aconitate 2-methyltransferase